MVPTGITSLLQDYRNVYAATNIFQRVEYYLPRATLTKNIQLLVISDEKLLWCAMFL